MEQELNAVLDIPDERDILYEGLLGADRPLAVEFPYDELNIQNQGSEYISRMGCSRF